MIVEEKPLHKKHKRLAKQRSLKEFQTNLPSPYFLGKHVRFLYCYFTILSNLKSIIEMTQFLYIV